MNSATNVLVGSIKLASKSSQHFAFLTGSISSLPATTTTTFTLSGFDSNFTSANNGQAVNLLPGVYEAISYINFPQPVNGTGSQFASTFFTVSGTNAVCNPSNVQTNAFFNGWPANYTVSLYGVSYLYMPSGGTLAMQIYQSLGGTVSNAALTLSLKLVTPY